MNRIIRVLCVNVAVIIIFIILNFTIINSNVLAQTINSASQLSDSARSSPLFRRSATTSAVDSLGLSKIDLGNGIQMQFKDYLNQTSLNTTLNTSQLQSSIVRDRYLTAQPLIKEEIIQLSDLIIVDRSIAINLRQGACDSANPPKAIGMICLKSKPGNLTSEITQDISNIRNNLLTRANNQMLRPELSVLEAKSMSDKDLLKTIFNSGHKKIRRVSVIPLKSFSRISAGSYPVLTPNMTKLNQRYQPISASELRLKKGASLRNLTELVKLKTTPTRSRAAEPTINFPEKHFLTGFTFGHELSDTWEITLADEGWINDRYFLKLSYQIGAGIGLRIPFKVDIEAASAVRTLASSQPQPPTNPKVRTIKQREKLVNRKKPSRNVNLVTQTVDVDDKGLPSYKAVGLDSTQYFDGDEFVLSLTASCSFEASIPGPNINYNCGSINKSKSKNFIPVYGNRTEPVGDFFINGDDIGLGYGLEDNGVWLDVGAAAMITKGKVGFDITPFANSKLMKLQNGTHWRNSIQPLRFTVAHKNYQNSKIADKIGFQLSKPQYQFTAKFTPQAKLRFNLDLGVFELNEEIGPFALDFLSVSQSLNLSGHDGTTKKYDFEM